MPSCLIFLPQEAFCDQSYKVILQLLGKAGIDCDTASITTDIAFGIMAMQTTPKLSLDHIKTDQYDALVLIGGPGVFDLIKEVSLLELIKSFHRQHKTIAVIDEAMLLLAHANLVNDKRIAKATFPEVEMLCKKRGAKIQAESIMEDDNLLSTSETKDLTPFARLLKNKLTRVLN